MRGPVVLEDVEPEDEPDPERDRRKHQPERIDQGPSIPMSPDQLANVPPEPVVRRLGARPASSRRRRASAGTATRNTWLETRGRPTSSSRRAAGTEPSRGRPGRPARTRPSSRPAKHRRRSPAAAVVASQSSAPAAAAPIKVSVALVRPYMGTTSARVLPVSAGIQSRSRRRASNSPESSSSRNSSIISAASPPRRARAAGRRSRGRCGTGNRRAPASRD